MKQLLTLVCPKCHAEYSVWWNPDDVFICTGCKRIIHDPRPVQDRVAVSVLEQANRLVVWLNQLVVKVIEKRKAKNG